MRKCVFALLWLALLAPFGGCRREPAPTVVFEDPNGHLVAGIGGQQKLTWKSVDTNLTQFWIRFNPPDYCVEARDGVVASVSGTATCTVNARYRSSTASYQIYKQNPTHGVPPGPPPPPNYIGPSHCVGCLP